MMDKFRNQNTSLRVRWILIMWWRLMHVRTISLGWIIFDVLSELLAQLCFIGAGGLLLSYVEKFGKPLSRRGGLYFTSPNIQRGQDQNRRKLALVRIFLCRSLRPPLSTRIQHVPLIEYVFCVQKIRQSGYASKHCVLISFRNLRLEKMKLSMKKWVLYPAQRCMDMKNFLLSKRHRYQPSYDAHCVRLDEYI